MGAKPKRFFNLRFDYSPETDPQWLPGFSGKVMAKLAERLAWRWWVGDTTKGPLTITLQVAWFMWNQIWRKRCSASKSRGDI